MTSPHRFLQAPTAFPVPGSTAADGIPLSNPALRSSIRAEGRSLRITLSGGAVSTDDRVGSEAPQSAELVLSGQASWVPAPVHSIGDLELHLPPEWRVLAAQLDLLTGEAELDLEGPGRGSRARTRAKLRASMLRDAPVLCLRVTGTEGAGFRVSAHPAARCASDGGAASEVFDFDELGGWTQHGPDSLSLCAAWSRHASENGLLLYLAVVGGSDAQDARRQALAVLDQVRGEGYTPVTVRSFGEWRKWWERTAIVELPCRILESLFYFGAYRMAGSLGGELPWESLSLLAADFSEPGQEDLSLLGPRVQALCSPCFAANHPDCLPAVALREAIDSLPAGAGAGWLAHLLWLRYRFTLDETLLRELTYPALLCAYRSLTSELTASPELAESSARLAEHAFVVSALAEASAAIGTVPAEVERWRTLAGELPPGVCSDAPELLLAPGEPLRQSRPDHTHLSAIYPFDLLDFHGSEAHRRLAHGSLRRLTEQGPGRWDAVSVPLAAALHARSGNGETAEWLLHAFARYFVGPGHAPERAARIAGFSSWESAAGRVDLPAAAAAATAVLEMLCHTQQGVLRVFPAIPPAWGEARFWGLRAEGAFLVSAEWAEGAVTAVQIQSETGGRLRLANPWGDEPVVVRRGGGTRTHFRGRRLEMPTSAGEILIVMRSLAGA